MSKPHLSTKPGQLQNIQIIGGSYNGNGSDGGAGIAIVGAVEEIQIQGANCTGPSQSLPSQQYGILVAAGSNIQISGCDCSANGNSPAHPGVGIAISNENGTTSGVRIVGSTCIGDALGQTVSQQQYGISISGASSVYVNDCTLAGSTSGGAGLAVSGEAAGVFISDCDCSGNPYGISVTGSRENVYANDCNLNGSATGPLHTSSPGTLQVVDCPGYNDQGTVLTGVPASGGSFDGPTFGYYGPIAFYATSSPEAAISEIAIDGTTTHLVSGGFTLNAPAPDDAAYVGQKGSITYSPAIAAPYFVVVGQ